MIMRRSLDAGTSALVDIDNIDAEGRVGTEKNIPKPFHPLKRETFLL